MRLRVGVLGATLAAAPLAAGLAGCGAGDRPPRGVLADSTLVEVLVGVHLAAARAAHTGEPAESLRVAALAHAGTDTTALREALNAYAQRPAALVAVYDRVLDRLAQADDGAVLPAPTLDLRDLLEP